MEITFRVSEEDLIAISDHIHGTSKTLRRSTLRAVIVSPLIFTAGAAGIWLATGDPVIPAALLFSAVLLLLTLPRRFKNVRRRLNSRIFREGKNRALFEPQILRIEHDVLVNETIAGESRTKWTYIEKVDVTEDRTFVFLNVARAHVIPRHGILRGDYEFFVDELQRRWRKADADKSADVSLHV